MVKKKRTILFGERIEKKHPEDHGWVTLYDSRKENPKLETVTLLDKKSIIFFPGDGANSERQANGCCKAVQGMLLQAGVNSEDMPHLYGLAYQGGEQDKHRYQVLTELKQAQFGSEYIAEDSGQEEPYYQPFFDEYILPLMVDEKGNPRSISEIKKNIQNVTFVTHCHGGFVAYQIEKMIMKKLETLYPKHVEDLMSNIRMIHFSSRRPQGQMYGKHLDIISQNDEMFADEYHLEYDNIHKQIHRAPLSDTSALIPVSPNEEILVFKRLTEETSNIYGEDPDHSKVLQIFSGEFKNQVPENTEAIQFVCQILRHFVEHPDDKKNLSAQLRALNALSFDENRKCGENFLSQEKEEEKIRRGLLSLIADLNADFADPKKNANKDMLRQKDDNGRFLFEELKKRYQKTGSSRSLISYIRGTDGLLSEKERGDLAVLAVRNHDWSLFNTLGGKSQSGFQATPSQLSRIISEVGPEDLYHLFYFLRSSNISCKLNKQPEVMLLLMRKIKKIKRVLQKKQLGLFLKSKLENIFYVERNIFKSLLKQSSMQEKKYLKSLLVESRQNEAVKLFSLMKERGKLAPELRIGQMAEYHTIARQYSDVTLQDYREFSALQKKSSSLTFDSFFREKRRINQNKER